MLDDLYRRARAKGYPAKVALSVARAESAPIRYEWNDDGATFEQDGFDVRVRVRVDEYADGLEFYGSFTDTFEPGAVKNPNHGYQHHVYEWFVPAYSIEERRTDLHKGGCSRGVADERARAAANEDAKRASDLTEYVLTVEVSREGIELGSDSLGGIDIGDVYGPDAWREFESIVDDHGMIETAMDEARDTIERLCS